MKNNRDCDNRSCENREVQTRQIKNETEDTFFGYECKDFTKDCEIQSKQNTLKLITFWVTSISVMET